MTEDAEIDGFAARWPFESFPKALCEACCASSAAAPLCPGSRACPAHSCIVFEERRSLSLDVDKNKERLIEKAVLFFCAGAEFVQWPAAVTRCSSLLGATSWRSSQSRLVTAHGDRALPRRGGA